MIAKKKGEMERLQGLVGAGFVGAQTAIDSPQEPSLASLLQSLHSAAMDFEDLDKQLYDLCYRVGSGQPRGVPTSPIQGDASKAPAEPTLVQSATLLLQRNQRLAMTISESIARLRAVLG